MKHQRITKQSEADLLAAAAEVMGGEPVKPPTTPTQPVKRESSPPVPTGDAAKRDAFTRSIGGTPPPPAFGNPTLDGLPPELLERRSKAAAVRRDLASLAARVLQDHARISAVLDDLADDAEDIQAAEHFDIGVARVLIDGLKRTVDSLTHQPAAPAEPPTPEEVPAAP